MPRERFTRLEDVARSARDAPLPLTEDGRSTLSALHAYERAYRALHLKEGDSLADLGGGSGYGAAVAARVVGPGGRVVTVELDPDLSARARLDLAGYPQVAAVHGDAHDTALWRGAAKLFCAFAVAQVPAAWVAALPEGGVMVLPVGARSAQRLLRLEKRDGRAEATDLGAVRFVTDRTGRSGGFGQAPTNDAPGDLG